MKNNFLYNTSLLLLVGLLVSFALPPKTSKQTSEEGSVRWYTWTEAVELNKKQPKKIFVDVYTTWCGPCKMMDKNTFSNPDVAAYLNKHFYAVKFDAEQKDDLLFDGHLFKYVKNGSRGVHLFAYSILDQKLMYPSAVFLDEKVTRTTIMPGYMDAINFMQVLKYHAENHYKTKTWEVYKNSR